MGNSTNFYDPKDINFHLLFLACNKTKKGIRFYVSKLMYHNIYLYLYKN